MFLRTVLTAFRMKHKLNRLRSRHDYLSCQNGIIMHTPILRSVLIHLEGYIKSVTQFNFFFK